jgi:FAD:protein FMN transferase
MITRRKLLLGFGALAASAISLRATNVTVTRPGTAFGTIVRLTVTAASPEIANAAIDAGFAEIRAVHDAASLFDSKSEVSRLNRDGHLLHPSALLRNLVASSDRLYHRTQGAFDPTVQPLWQAWNVQQGDQIAQLMSRIGWSKLSVTHEALELRDSAALTFNGIAQGYAADRVMAALKTHGASSARVDTGETALNNFDEQLTVQHPRGGVLGELKITEGFVAVSGDYASHFTPDFMHHHIFDPASGFSPLELASVIVIAPSGTLADGLATAFMVMGVAKSLSCLSAIEDCHAVFVDKAGTLTLSPDMSRHFAAA